MKGGAGGRVRGRTGRAAAFLRVGAALLVLLPAASPALAHGLVDLIKRIKPGIVGIGTYQELRRPPAKLKGTGFAVADGRLVVTNFHVVPGEIDTARGERLAVFIGAGDDVSVVPAQVAAQDPAHDVAVLRISGRRLPALPLGDGAQAQEGGEIAFTGFPIGTVLGLYPVTHRGMISARTPIAIPQISPKRLDTTMIRRLRERFDVLQLDATAYPGNSGSPLYLTETGEVVGIVSSVFVKKTKEKVLSEPSGITYAVPISYARALLRRIGATE